MHRGANSHLSPATLEVAATSLLNPVFAVHIWCTDAREKRRKSIADNEYTCVPSQGTVAMAKEKHPPLPNVHFRWDNEEFASLLADSANEAGAASSHRHARELLKTVLMSEDTESHDLRVLHQEVAQLRQRIERLSSQEGHLISLREDLATSVHRLLIEAGRVDPDEALRWVQETLLEPKG